ncbi:MAG: hypothetical protein JWQ34_88 [Mucilaginibacter sp.]|uniref:hypothetical protein n=1 Tax=Mucilaginibacter sp. TaxID=1882438 RepID=UPI0026153E56|nr:hypothetical protein [Mucilaginibacter sp.]MDB5001863.1 hypothetical protein [Mucilaginibacter sp.]
MKKEKGIDDIFKHGLRDPVDETEFRESDWDAFENMLDERKPKGGVFWLPMLGSAAAILLAFFGWWMFRPQTSTVQNTQQVAVNPKGTTQAQTPVEQRQAAAVNQPEKTGPIVSNSANAAKNEKTTTQQNKLQPQYLAARINNGKHGIGGATHLGQGKYEGNSPVFANVPGARDTVQLYSPLAAINPTTDLSVSNDFGSPALASVVGEKKTGINALVISSAPAIKKTGLSAFHPQFAIRALAASEVNGVGSFQSSSKGTNIGLLFSVGVKKFSLTTGASYSTKPYTIPYSQYNTSYKLKYEPEYVTADCRVLDIPINLGYQLYNKSSNKISIGAGMSSYIMMHESYTYDYGTSSTLYGPSYYAVKTRGKYLFSIMNLEATYERKVNSKVGLSLTPYYKIPLSDIGYSQVRVQTFGVAVGLNWNINLLTKPK